MISGEKNPAGTKDAAGLDMQRDRSNKPRRPRNQAVPDNGWRSGQKQRLVLLPEIPEALAAEVLNARGGIIHQAYSEAYHAMLKRMDSSAGRLGVIDAVTTWAERLARAPRQSINRVSTSRRATKNSSENNK